MRRFLVTAGMVLALGGVSATGALADFTGTPGQPSQSCQATDPPAFPGNTGSSPGSAFNGTANGIYANPNTQGGISSGNTHVVAQYDVACFQQASH